MGARKRHSLDEIRQLFDRCRGICHLCRKRVSLKNYGVYGARGAWEVDHLVPIAKGGSNHGNNLRIACTPCNREKSTVTSRTARRWNGHSRAPLTRSRYEAAKTENRVAGAGIGAGVGALFGPGGALLGGLIGLALGDSADPDE